MKNWTYNFREVLSLDDTPKDSIGFVYKITDSTGRIYIGQKSLYSTRKKPFGKKKLAEITDKRAKKYELVTKESKWLTYTGSNKELNENIKNGMIVTREILHWCFSKKQLSYYEIKYMMIEGVIEPGSLAYNGNILGRYFPRDLVNTKKEE